MHLISILILYHANLLSSLLELAAFCVNSAGFSTLIIMLLASKERLISSFTECIISFSLYFFPKKLSLELSTPCGIEAVRVNAFVLFLIFRENIHFCTIKYEISCIAWILQILSWHNPRAHFIFLFLQRSLGCLVSNITKSSFHVLCLFYFGCLRYKG